MRKGVGDARGASFENMNVVAAIVGEGRSEIKTAKAVGSPRRPGIGGFVYYNELPWRVEGVGKEINGVSMDAMVCRDRRIAVKGTEVVQCKFYVRKELVPEIEGELGMNRGESSNHMVFESADGPFSKISAMVGGRLELNSDRNRWGAKVGVEIRGEFVVDSKVGDSMATGVEESDSRCISFEIGSSRFGRHRFSMYVSLEYSDEDVLIQPTRLDRETACKVGAGPVSTGGDCKGEGRELGDIVGKESRVRGKESSNRIGRASRA